MTEKDFEKQLRSQPYSDKRRLRLVCAVQESGRGFEGKRIVIVFVPSYDEDNGLITCGNAILSGKKPTSSYKEVVF